MRLLLVRHGLTQSNVQGRYTGQLDVPLTEMGERQAEAVGKRLASEPLNIIISSDLQRARATAAAIARYHDHLTIHYDTDLRETSLGEWEGLTYREVNERYVELVNKRRADPNFPAPGGESFIQVRDRVMRARQRWQSQYPDATMLWVTHAGVIETAVCAFLGLDLTFRRHFRHDNASITEFDLRRDYAILAALNITDHLREPMIEPPHGKNTPFGV